MVDAKTEIVTKLSTDTSLNVYYDLIEHPYSLPCITYSIYDNRSQTKGNVIEYSSVGAYVKLWGTDFTTLMPYAIKIDKSMNELGYTRQSYNEMNIDEELCLIFQYRGLAKEERN